METKHLWAAILPYGKWAEYIAEYAEAVVADDRAGIQIAILSLPFSSDGCIYPFLYPASAYDEITEGETIFAVAVPYGNCEGSWVSDNQVYREPSIITDNPLIAHMLGRAYQQQSILLVSGRGTSGYAYLLEDTPANRGIALSVAGGYTAGDGYLLVATSEPLPTEALQGEIKTTRAKIELITP